MTESIASALTADHRRCDLLMVEVERAAEAKDWTEAGRAAEAFGAALEGHFRYEEEVLFPALEARLPMANGPTGVMRMEHAQMRRMLADLGAAVAGHGAADCLGLLETLHLIAQQHNAKEEGILYAMADAALAGESARLLSQFDPAA